MHNYLPAQFYKYITLLSLKRTVDPVPFDPESFHPQGLGRLRSVRLRVFQSEVSDLSLGGRTGKDAESDAPLVVGRSLVSKASEPCRMPPNSVNMRTRTIAGEYITFLDLPLSSLTGMGAKTRWLLSVMRREGVAEMGSASRDVISWK